MLYQVKNCVFVVLLILPFIATAQSRFLKTTNLECVADGIENATGMYPSEKYIALVGFAVQRNHRYSKSTSGGDSKATYLQRVIEIIQANGFCTANKIDGGGRLTKELGYGTVDTSVRSNKAAPFLPYAVAGLGAREFADGTTQSALDSKQMKQVVKYFGFKKEDDITDIFYAPGWASMDPGQRQNLFREHVGSTSPTRPEERTVNSGMYTSDDNGEGLKDCFSQLKQLQGRDSLFNFKNGRRSDSRKFCETIARACYLDEPSTFCYQSAVPVEVRSGGKKVPDESSGGPSLFDAVRGEGAK